MDPILLQQLMFALFLIAVLIIYGYFRKIFNKLRISSSKKENQLIQTISIHHLQLQRRKLGLDRYDFLKYNLSEALIIQPEIKIL